LPNKRRGRIPLGWSLLFLLLISFASMTFTAHAASSDLTVESIWLEDASQIGQPVSQVSPGQSFNIIATIKNIGQDAASGYYLDVYYDSDYGRGGPDNIAPGEVQTWYVGPLTAQAGTHTTKWVVDPDNQIVELDESNNQKEYTFTIGAQTTTTTSTSTSTTILTTQTSTTTTSTSTSTTTTTTTSSTSTTPTPPTVSITLTANPSGSIVVDGATYTSQQTFTWIPGSSHTIAANSPVSGAPGTQYVWASWADGGTQSRTITAPSSSTTYTASYKTQWQVAFAVSPSGVGAITVNGQPSATAWYDDGASVSMQANPSAGYAFSSWSSDVASITFATSSAASTTATIRGTGTITANFLQNATPPVITPTITPSANGNGWNNGPVTVSWSVSNPESGIASSTGCTTTILTTETPQNGTTLTCTATSGAGLSKSVSVTVKIDLAAPTLTLPSTVTAEATGPGGATVSYVASASDSLSGIDGFSCTPASGSTFPIAATAVSCSATDKAGNTATGSFKVTVADTTPPKLSIPSDMNVQASSTGAVVTFSASASDLVDGSIPITCTPASGSTFPLGTNTVTCSATDKTGNKASASFKVTVTPSSSTVTVTVKLLDSNKNGLSSGVVQYYSGGWLSFGTTGSDGTVSMALPSGTYAFKISYNGASQQKSQDIRTDPNVIFQTTLVTMKLLSSTNTELGGGAQYYAGGWKTFGAGATTTTMQLLPLTYTFHISYGGASQQMSQNVATNPNVVFKTTLVTMKLVSSTNAELSGGAQYYAGGWKTFGGGKTTTTMELLPVTYAFQVSWAGASQKKSQNVATNPNVVFQTVQVHSDSGKCTSYYAGGWRTFTQDMELLPGTYTFRFSDKTANTSYALVVGAVKHIH